MVYTTKISPQWKSLHNKNGGKFLVILNQLKITIGLLLNFSKTRRLLSLLFCYCKVSKLEQFHYRADLDVIFEHVYIFQIIFANFSNFGNPNSEINEDIFAVTKGLCKKESWKITKKIMFSLFLNILIYFGCYFLNLKIS